MSIFFKHLKFFLQVPAVNGNEQNGHEKLENGHVEEEINGKNEEKPVNGQEDVKPVNGDSEHIKEALKEV